jgi:hypothetical protein
MIVVVDWVPRQASSLGEAGGNEFRPTTYTFLNCSGDGATGRNAHNISYYSSNIRCCEERRPLGSLGDPGRQKQLPVAARVAAAVATALTVSAQRVLVSLLCRRQLLLRSMGR